MKRVTMIFGILFSVGLAMGAYAESSDSPMGHMMHHNMTQPINDDRISLGLSPEMAQHQLANMRSHVEAVQSIVGLLVEGAFDKASQIAHSKLGLTDKMKKMCNRFTNEKFRKLGFAFHESGDALGDALQTKDTNKSLSALHTTMGYCVQCHATFRQ